MQDIKKQRIKELISQKRIVTLDEIKSHLETDVRVTIMRKLNELPYLSSYSHRGKYYTLLTIPRFSDLGIWSYHSVHFSKYNTLVNTCLQIINNSVAGYSVKELDKILKVSVSLSIFNLFKAGQLFRASFDHELVYFSTNNRLKKQQMAIRESQYANEVFSTDRLGNRVITENIKKATILFYGTLNEKQRRLYAGLEAMKAGYGGDKLIGGLLQINPETVSKGREELATGDFEKEGVRKPGGGRLAIKKNSRNNTPD